MGKKDFFFGFFLNFSQINLLFKFTMTDLDHQPRNTQNKERNLIFALTQNQNRIWTLYQINNIV